MKTFFQKNWIHFAAVAVMFIIVAIYFQPVFDGYALKQHDLEQWRGMAQEIIFVGEKLGEYPLWTNSMFAGMPAVQIMMSYGGNLFHEAMKIYYEVVSLPIGLVFLHMISFYFMALMLRIRPLIALMGAIAYSFASYEIIIIQAGHSAKSMASAYLPLLLGMFIYAYRYKNWLAIVCSGIVMTVELSSNHVQVTYYMIFVLMFVGVYFFIDAIKKKEMTSFMKVTIGLILAYGMAGVINSPNILLTNEYAKNTIRGTNDITIAPDGTEATNQSKGLDRDYITNWSYGIGETFTFLSPDVKGGGSFVLGDSQFQSILDDSDLSSESKNNLRNFPAYWGEQPFTSGPVYIGVVVVMLAFLGLIFLKTELKWALFAATLLAIGLSWGKNYVSASVLLPIILFLCIPFLKGRAAFFFAVGNMLLLLILFAFGDMFVSKSLTNFFIDYVPGYNKFRTVTIVLIIVELCVPVLGVLFLNLLVNKKEELKEKKNLLILAVVGFFIFLFVVKIVGLGDGYTSQSDRNQLAGIEQNITKQISSMDPNALMSQYNLDVNNPKQLEAFVGQQMEQYEKGFEDLKVVRQDIFDASLNRSLMFTFFAGVLILLFVFVSLPSVVVMGGALLLVMMDMIPVANQYLGKQEVGTNYKYWEDKGVNKYPFAAREADEQIMQMEIQANPALEKVIRTAEQFAKEKASDLGIEGAGRKNMINSYRFSELGLATNYRVFDMSGGFNSSYTSYLHKSFGGYHGAKLRNFANLIDFHVAQGNNKVFDMLNVKYFIHNNEQGSYVQPNVKAKGNAWLVKRVETYDTPNDEIRALGTRFKLVNEGVGELYVNGKKTKESFVYGAENIRYVISGSDSVEVPLSNGMSEGMSAIFVMDKNGKPDLVMPQVFDNDTARLSFLKMVKVTAENEFKIDEEVVMLKEWAKKLSQETYTAEGTVAMTKYNPDEITYDVNVKGKQLIVFSEVFYPEGWTATVDGKTTEILKVNYLLRAIEVPDGQHKVVLSFDLPKYHTLNKASFIACIALIVAFIGVLYFELKKRKKVQE